MDLFFRLFFTVCASFSGQRNATLWEGTTYTFRPLFWERTLAGMFYPSRVASFVDISLIKFFIETRMSEIVRRNRWVPLLLSSVQIRQDAGIPKGVIKIHTQAIGWQDQYVELRHTWRDQEGQEFLRCDYLTRVSAPKKAQVTGEDMLVALGQDTTPRPLSAAAEKQLQDYLVLKAANSRSAGAKAA